MSEIKEALFFKKEKDGGRCLLCPHRCYFQQGEMGICRARKYIERNLYALNYASIGAMAVDPIEKKPLYHFYPGSFILSLGTAGCNLSCDFCQNWRLVQSDVEGMSILSPEKLKQLLQDDPRLKEQLGVAYTYAEPFVWYEYLRDCVSLVRSLGKKNVLVTNGYINQKPLQELLPFIDAMNIDVKAFQERFYQRNCGGSLKPVLETVKTSLQSCHVEITYLIIPGENDSPAEIKALACWLGAMGRNIPLHFSRYFPSYKKESPPPTPPATLRQARDIALEYLNYVYIGNLNVKEGSNTYCVYCKYLLVDRTGFNIRKDFNESSCPQCGYEVGKAFKL